MHILIRLGDAIYYVTRYFSGNFTIVQMLTIKKISKLCSNKNDTIKINNYSLLKQPCASHRFIRTVSATVTMCTRLVYMKKQLRKTVHRIRILYKLSGTSVAVVVVKSLIIRKCFFFSGRYS